MIVMFWQFLKLNVCNIEFFFLHLNNQSMQTMILVMFCKLIQVIKMQAHQVPWDQFSETWSCIVPWEKVMDILKQLTCIASVKTKIRNKFKVVSAEKLCMAVFINCKGRVF